MLTVRWADLHDSLDHRFSELHIWVVFETIAKEFEQGTSFLRNSVIQLAHRLDRLNFKFNAQVWEVGTDLLEKLLDLVLVACFEQS